MLSNVFRASQREPHTDRVPHRFRITDDADPNLHFRAFAILAWSAQSCALPKKHGSLGNERRSPRLVSHQSFPHLWKKLWKIARIVTIARISEQIPVPAGSEA